MPLTIVTTPGDANANSYASVTEATAFNAGRPFGGAWASADAETQKAALIWSTILLDASFQWTGSAVTDTQALMWPRNGMLTRKGFAIDPTTIPTDLKNAQCEWARRLIEGDMAGDNVPFKIGLQEVKAGPVDLKFQLPGQVSNTVDLRNADIQLKDPIFAYLQKWVPDVLLAMLVPSWWYTDTLGQPFIFEGSV